MNAEGKDGSIPLLLGQILPLMLLTQSQKEPLSYVAQNITHGGRKSQHVVGDDLDSNPSFATGKPLQAQRIMTPIPTPRVIVRMHETTSAKMLLGLCGFIFPQLLFHKALPILDLSGF